MQLIPVILSGGAGTRLWPLSTEQTPKQFLLLAGEESLLQQTALRAKSIAQSSSPIVVANQDHERQILGELEAVGCPPSRLLLEPIGRYTAPALAMAALECTDENALLLVMPSDHVIRDVESFGDAVHRALPLAQDGRLETFGITPDRPATGYGYIDMGEPLSGEICRVNCFVEKPEAARAERMLADGRYVWNAGIFLLRSDRLTEELAVHAPGLLGSVRKALATADREGNRVAPDRATFASVEAKSIDYVVMEHAARMAVVPVDVGWSDIGSWDALHEIEAQDDSGNALHGDVLALESHECLIRTSGPHVAALPGRVAVTAVSRIVLPAASAIPPIALPPEIERALRDGAWAVFNLSGGKDSSAALFATMLALDAIGHPRSRRIAVHADLGRAEWDSTPDMVEALAVRAEIPLHVRRRRGGDLIDRWEQRFANGKARYENLEIYNLIGPWSSASLRFCTSEQKAQVLGPFLAREFAGETIVQIIGIRRDESAARSKAPEWKPDDRFARPGNANGTAMMVWHPIVHWATDQVFALHDALGIPLHEAYTCYGSTRLSCRYCVLQSLADAKASASAPTNREALLQLVDLEARSTFSFQPARWLADTAPHLLPTTLRADIERAKRDAAERRALEAAMPADLRFCKGWPPRLPTLDEATRIAASRASILARHRLDNRFSDARAVRSRFEQLMLAKSA